MTREEFLSIAQAHLAKQVKHFDLRSVLFDKQLEFVLEPHPFKTACCGGRAGKTVADAAYLIHAAQSRPRGVALYLTLSRTNAKKLVWPEIKNLIHDHKLSAKVNEADLSVEMPNGSFIYASGASTAKEVEKFRGLPLIICIIDEVQSFPSYVQVLIDDVISKRLFDFGGTLALTGTPGPVPVGYFYEATQSPGYKHFHWTMFDNPHIERKSGMTAQALLEREMARKGVDIYDPSIQREVFGKWANDPNALVFRYDRSRNHYDNLPETDGIWNHIIGVDLGHDDADALCVIGFNRKLSSAYLVDEIIKTKQGITELAAQIESLIALYKPDRIVMDTGGLGKKIAEEMKKRYALPITAADKARKFEFIEILNDAMRTERFFAKRDSQFANDAMLLEWDKEAPRLKINENFHSDILDAALYAFRESLHWLYEPEPAKIEPGTEAWVVREVEQMEQSALDALRLKQEQENPFEW